MSQYGYFFAYFDILGFKNMINKPNGLEGILNVYLELTEIINKHNDHYKKLKEINISPGVYAIQEGIYVIYEVNILYGSDSIFIWSNRTWEELEKVKNDINKIHFATQYFAKPRICDPFLEVCNEIFCRSLELGFPLRGAISMGDGYFDFTKHIFIGKLIVDAITLEGMQDLVGASFHLSFEEQKVPDRFRIKFEDYINPKKHCENIEKESYTNQNVIDWPRHWRNTRKKNIEEVIDQFDFGKRSDIKNNTIRLIKESLKYSDKFESVDEVNLFNVYPEIFSKTDGFPIRFIHI